MNKLLTYSLISKLSMSAFFQTNSVSNVIKTFILEEKCIATLIQVNNSLFRLFIFHISNVSESWEKNNYNSP